MSFVIARLNAALDAALSGVTLGASIDVLRDESREDHRRVTERIDHQSERIDVLEQTVAGLARQEVDHGGD